MLALVAEHKAFTADRAEGFESSGVRVSAHFDLVFAVGAVFRNDIGPLVVNCLIR